eukprot:739575-Pyramimonas_sp.AAC.1
MEDIVFFFVEREITCHVLLKFARRCSRGHDSMPRLVPSSALSTCATDAFNHVEASVASATRVTTLGSRLREFCELICTSDRGQSGRRGRAAGLPVGGGGGASPPCGRP